MTTLKRYTPIIHERKASMQYDVQGEWVMYDDAMRMNDALVEALEDARAILLTFDTTSSWCASDMDCVRRISQALKLASTDARTEE